VEFIKRNLTIEKSPLKFLKKEEGLPGHARRKKRPSFGGGLRAGREKPLRNREALRERGQEDLKAN